VRQLFARNNKWLENLNSKYEPIDPDGDVKPFLLRSIFLTIFQSFPKVTFYDYPNEDFCLFSKFPHNKLVFPQLRPNHNSNCTCTEAYLIQYSIKHQYSMEDLRITTGYSMFQYYMNEINDQIFSNCIDDLQELILNCNFKQRLQQCKIKTVTKNEASSYFEMYDWLEVRKLTSLIFSVYLNSIFSLIIIILNILTLKIIKSKSVLKEKNPMYDFLFLNTLMSMIYIIIVLFKIIGICVNNNDYYCSPLNETKFNIYYKTIFILFCGETLKTISNFSYLSFSLSRYIKITSTTKLSILLKFDKLKKKYYFFISLIIAIFINLFYIFEYNFSLSKSPDYFEGQDSFESFFKYSNPSDEFIDNTSNLQYYVLNTFFYVKVIFSDFSYIILNLIIDLKLLSFIKIQNSTKNTIIRLIIINNNNSNNNKKQVNSTTNRLTGMIFLNGINCFLLRFPSAFANFYGFIFRYDKSDKMFKPNIPGYIVCRHFKICPNLQEILYFFYLISVFLQFFIFFKFDKLFRKGYNEIKKIFLKKIKI